MEKLVSASLQQCHFNSNCVNLCTYILVSLGMLSLQKLSSDLHPQDRLNEGAPNVLCSSSNGSGNHLVARDPSFPFSAILYFHACIYIYLRMFLVFQGCRNSEVNEPCISGLKCSFLRKRNSSSSSIHEQVSRM